nr:putative Ig domain-containing protein [uncultured Rhodopila sp.]
MAVTLNATAFVNAKAASIAVSQIVSTAASSSNPAYLVLTALDRNEYTAGATGATGNLSGNGHVLNLSSLGGDGRGAGIIFTYIAASGRYYNSTYGYLDQLTYNASGSLDDVTNLSFFGTGSLGLATDYANNAYLMMQTDAPGYLGSATVVTEQGYSGTVPGQATPDSIAAAAGSFVGKAWNMNGCWVLASTIAAEAGASLPVQSTAIGVAGQANGEWIVAYNGPAGQGGNWQSMVTAGEIIAFGTGGGSGHITTCVSGSGASAMLVDNITYENYLGQITNPANDGSASDVLVAAPHAASQEWSGVSGSSVVIYELDTPAVTASAGADYLFAGASQSLGSLFSAADPAGKTIAEWQVYDTAAEDSFSYNGGRGQAHSAATAITSASLASVSLLAGSGPAADTLEVRAFNGSYWGDWASLAVTVTAGPKAPVLNAQTAAQTWVAGQSISLALAANTFADPQAQPLTYKAALSGGAALPAWLTFNAATETFAGTAPTGNQTLSIVVTATDSSGLSASETIAASVISPPKLAVRTANQIWNQGRTISLALAGTFTDPQGGALSYKAALAGGQALPNWLTFNAATQTFSGGAPGVAQTLSIAVTATDSFGLSSSETFSATVIAAPKVAAATPNQTWAEGRAVSLALPAGTFADPQGEKLTYAATQWNGSALPNWLTFNAATGTFSGTAPATAQTLNILVTATNSAGLSVSEQFAAAILPPPVVAAATAAQTWLAGRTISLALPAGTFTDPLGQKLIYKATLANGQALPGWLTFNAAAETFTGTAPAGAQTLGILVTATDSSGLAVSETISATVIGAPVLAAATPGQTWVAGKAISLALPATTFADPQGQKLTYKAALANGQPLPNWLTFNAATETFSGNAPNAAQSLGITVTATDSSGLSASESFTASVQAATSASAKAMTVSLQPAGKIAAVVPAGSILAWAAGSSGATMGFLAADTAAPAAAGYRATALPAPGGIMSFAALAADGGLTPPAGLFPASASAGWLPTASGTEAAAFGAALFDPAQTPGLPGFHT